MMGLALQIAPGDPVRRRESVQYRSDLPGITPNGCRREPDSERELLRQRKIKRRLAKEKAPRGDAEGSGMAPKARRGRSSSRLPLSGIASSRHAKAQAPASTRQSTWRGSWPSAPRPSWPACGTQDPSGQNLRNARVASGPGVGPVNADRRQSRSTRRVETMKAFPPDQALVGLARMS